MQAGSGQRRPNSQTTAMTWTTSGMIDIAVTSETGPNAVLTLDKRFVAPPTEELLHTSGFTVVGKVTQVWRDTEDIVNLYRRSVVSLLPSLAQSTAWGGLHVARKRGVEPRCARDGARSV